MMKINFSESLKRLAKLLDKPLYAVGGCVRGALLNNANLDYLCDVDLAGAINIKDIKDKLDRVGFKYLAEYPKTGTLVFKEKELPYRYEYTTFRTESYPEGGAHVPEKTVFTDSILEDALRRDFKCNAVYYDILNEKIVDPLNGVKAIENKLLDTVKDPLEVFADDGLRLMRLSRFAGELGFTPTERTKEGAKKFASNICDVSGERIYAEIERMLVADKKYPYSKPTGHYDAFKLCCETGVLKYIFPELVLGESMPQRKDFHKYDVLEHGFRALLYSNEKVRLAALLHDIGKPVVFLRDGTYHLHSSEGEIIARKRLEDLHVSKKVIEETCWLILNHMYDLTLDCTDIEVKKFIVSNYSRIDDLLLLKEADIKASSEDLVPKTVVRWKKLIADMKSSGTPFFLSELAVNGDDLYTLGIKGKLTGIILNKLFDEVLVSPTLNEREILMERAKNLSDQLP